MRIEPIKQIEQLTYKKKATTWEEVEAWEWNDPVKTNDTSKLPPQFAPDDGGCIANGVHKDVTRSGETLDIII